MFGFKRELQLGKMRTSAFLFGPRMTGKTTLLLSLPSRSYYDLLDPELELRLRGSPRLLWEELQALPQKSLIIIDEIQKVPSLLDTVQRGMDQLHHRFILSGSSARKLKRGGANLLGGRAISLKLHPLTVQEMGEAFHLQNALRFGTLPNIANFLVKKDQEEVRRLLKGYVTTYLKEEIQAEAITRNLSAFQRFLSIAAQSNAQVIEFANISRESSVPMSTVKEYYQILEDTLVGEFLWPHDRSERKKARPKFYFFDCGVVCALQNRLLDAPTPFERGFLFETWFFRELVRIRDYQEKEHTFALWRHKDKEIDFLVMGGRGPLLAIECKSGSAAIDSPTLNTFHKEFPKVPLVVASLTDERSRRLDSGIEIHPWKTVLQMYRDL